MHFRELDQMLVLEQSSRAQYYDFLARSEKGLRDRWKELRRGTFHDQVGQRLELGDVSHRYLDAQLVQGQLRPDGITCTNSGQFDPGHTLGEPGDQDATDGAKPGDGDAGHFLVTTPDNAASAGVMPA